MADKANKSAQKRPAATDEAREAAPRAPIVREAVVYEIDVCLTAYRRWLSDGYGGLSEAMESALNRLVEVGELDFPVSCLAIQIAVRQVALHWAKWLDEMRAKGGGVNNEVPPEVLFSDLEAAGLAAAQVRGAIRRAKVPPIERLLKQDVTLNQIAKMYDWWLEDGSPDTAKVEEEIKDPGRHTSPDKGWIDPGERLSRDEEARRRAEVAELTAMRKARFTDQTPAPTETLAELVTGKVSAKQIGRMLGMTEAEVRAACEAEGLPQPVDQYETTGLRGEFEPELPEALERAMDVRVAQGQAQVETQEAPEPSPVPPVLPNETTEESVVRLASEGKKVGEIAGTLGVSRKRVVGILRRLESEPEALGAK